MANTKATSIFSITTVLFLCVVNAATASTDFQTPATQTAPAPPSTPPPSPGRAPTPTEGPDFNQFARHILRSNASKEADRVQNAIAPPGATSRRSLSLDLGLVTAAVALVGLWRRTWRRRAVMASVRAAAAADAPAIHDAEWREACLEAGRGRFGDQAEAKTGSPLTSGDKA